MTTTEDFYETLKSDPKKIIEWAKSEIACYQELIKLIEKDLKKKGKTLTKQ